MHVPKLLKDELGGGKKEFSLADGKFQSILFFKRIIYQSSSGGDFVNIEKAEAFLSSADRQSILLHFLNSIRADKGDTVGEVTFREGEAISKNIIIIDSK